MRPKRNDAFVPTVGTYAETALDPPLGLQWMWPAGVMVAAILGIAGIVIGIIR